MKCPKCGYLGFDDVDRCRNCGYEFSLDASAPALDLTIRRDTRTLTPLDDLALVGAPPVDEPRLLDLADLYRVLGAEPTPAVVAARIEAAHDEPTPASLASSASRSAGVAPAELPLFGVPISDDQPLITRASPPRAPLAVRRATPDVPKGRGDGARTPSFDLVLEDGAPIARGSQIARAAAAARDASSSVADASLIARLAAVVIDLAILAVIDAVVIYFTIQICGLTPADLDILPKGPLLAFLVVQNGGYLVAFTAGGQTLGKMSAGIRVVAAEAEAPLDLGRAFLRTSMWVLLAVPAGLGFLTAIVSRDRRGLHDRFAGTRVVRASA